jgi:hypothetical protein
MQLPKPSQWCPVSVDPEQVAAPHDVLALNSLQAPWPSQLPSFWQLVEASLEQSLSGSVSTFTLPQTPSAPEPFLVALHAWQGALQAVSQHTPSTQWAFLHWLLFEQVAPSFWSGWQV